MADVINGLNVFGKTQSVVILEIRVVINGLFQVLRIVVNKNSVLFDLVSVDLVEVHFSVFLDDFVEFFGTGYTLILLFHSDLIDISTNLISESLLSFLFMALYYSYNPFILLQLNPSMNKCFLHLSHLVRLNGSASKESLWEIDGFVCEQKTEKGQKTEKEGMN